MKKPSHILDTESLGKLQIHQAPSYYQNSPFHVRRHIYMTLKGFGMRTIYLNCEVN